jgi:hypothetical protein
MRPLPPIGLHQAAVSSFGQGLATHIQHHDIPVLVDFWAQ